MRLIDADEFKGISWNSMSEMQEYTAGFDDGACYVLSKIDDAPTVDAVPVVRCRDCKHKVIFKESGFEFPDTICPLYDREGYLDNKTLDEDYYCADGERRENNEAGNA